MQIRSVKDMPKKMVLKLSDILQIGTLMVRVLDHEEIRRWRKFLTMSFVSGMAKAEVQNQ